MEQHQREVMDLLRIILNNSINNNSSNNNMMSKEADVHAAIVEDGTEAPERKVDSTEDERIDEDESIDEIAEDRQQEIRVEENENENGGYRHDDEDADAKADVEADANANDTADADVCPERIDEDKIIKDDDEVEESIDKRDNKNYTGSKVVDFFNRADWAFGAFFGSAEGDEHKIVEGKERR